MSEKVENETEDAIKKANSIRRNKVINEYLDRITDYFVVMFEEINGIKLIGSDKEFFRIKSKGILYYWLSVVYDEAISEVKNLESALNTSKNMVKKLRDSQTELQAIIVKANSSLPVDPHDQINPLKNRDEMKTDPPPPGITRDFGSEIDGYYSHIKSKRFLKKDDK